MYKFAVFIIYKWLIYRMITFVILPLLAIQSKLFLYFYNYFSDGITKRIEAGSYVSHGQAIAKFRVSKST